MRKALSVSAIFALATLVPAQSALGAGEFDKYEVESVSASLSSTQAGAHADLTVSFELSQKEAKPYGLTRDIVAVLPPGVFGNPAAFPSCTSVQLGREVSESQCPLDSQVGSMDITLGGDKAGTIADEPIYNMPVAGGDEVARFGFFAGVYQLQLSVRLDPETHQLIAIAEGAPSLAELIGSDATFWGVPSDKSHDPERITPEESVNQSGPLGGRKSSLSGEVPFMTNPTSCVGPQEVIITARSYQLPDRPSRKSGTFPAITGCGALEFNPSATFLPTTEQATSPSGLDAQLSLPTKGLQFGKLTYGSEAKRAEVILPKGMTVNPSQAEGLGICSEADLARETYNSAPNAGCPETSKIGSVVATTPVLDREAKGSLYLAKPYANPFGSLLALYMVLKVPDRGVLVKMAGRVTLDPDTGQIATVFDDVPQLPVATFALHFREGARAPLVTPPACGIYQAVSNFNPWATPAKLTSRESPFNIDSGPDRSPCPSGGLPPFHPSLLAGTDNNRAGAFSPFSVRISRTDAEQEIGRFSIKLPPGIVGKLAGIPFCPDAAIEAAKARKGAHGGEEELLASSCPAASQVGTTLAGAGVGQVLVYVPGKVYLAGPYRGSPISIVAITAAKAGPFDLGTVVIREALRVDPETAEVFIDAIGSDPIPHIIQGVPVRLREIRAYVDRPDFVLNPTDCTRTSTASTVLGTGLDFTSEADDRPFTATSPFQAVDCAALPFKPGLALKLKGGTRRGAHPAFTAILKGQGLGAAGIARTQVTLPRSEFIENAHFNTICTRVQFKAGKVPGETCPAGAVYGKASAVTPLLDEPLSGPVFLRSSEHQLPDLVIALHSGKIDVTLVGRVDSVKGQLRTTFESVPDAPVTSFRLDMQGGKKGLFVNSTDLCAHKNKALAEFDGQNGKELSFRPVVQAKCGKGKGRRPSKRPRSSLSGR